MEQMNLFQSYYRAKTDAEFLADRIFSICMDYVNEKYPDENTSMDAWSYSPANPNDVFISIKTETFDIHIKGDKQIYSWTIKVPINELLTTYIEQKN